MNKKEIGSHFWLNEKPLLESADSTRQRLEWLPVMNDESLTFSGRNAIDLIFKDILAHHKIKTVWVPYYSCVSMLQGIIDNHISYKFYHIDYQDNHFSYHLPEISPNDVVLIMSYFGIDHHAVDKLAGKIKETGAVVVEDITHSLLSESAYSKFSDYLVASLRKWFPIPTGGWMGKKDGDFKIKPNLDSNHAVEGKLEGMLEKGAFISGKISEKESFLLKHAQFENDLIHLDRMLRIDDYSLNILRHANIEEIKEIRRNNGEFLISGLKQFKGLPLSVPSFNFSDTVPLFIPVFLPQSERDDLQKQLIEHSIYCPVHWPEVMGSEKGVRENELSLICDQRYGTSDMEAILSCIKNSNITR